MTEKASPAVPDLDLLQGTLDLLVLKALALGPLHGWAIGKRIQQISRDAFVVHQGSLYPALYRLESRGFLRGDEARSPEGRRIKRYALTAAGKRRLGLETQGWRAFAAAMRAALGARRERG